MALESYEPPEPPFDLVVATTDLVAHGAVVRWVKLLNSTERWIGARVVPSPSTLLDILAVRTLSARMRALRSSRAMVVRRTQFAGPYLELWMMTPQRRLAGHHFTRGSGGSKSIIRTVNY